MINKTEIIHYIKLILGKWVLWLFVVLDIIGALAQFFVPNFNLPTNIYGLLAIFGFLWAGYQVYYETKASYERLIEVNRSQLEKLSSEININAILKNPSLDLTLQEGHEYDFVFDDVPSLDEAFYKLDKIVNKVKTSDAPYFLPNSKLSVFLRIQNTGCNIDILSISVRWDNSDFPYSFSLDQVFLKNNIAIKYPYHLISDDNLECVLSTKVTPNSFHTKAQFASRLRDVRDKKYFLNGTVLLETVDGSGVRKDFSLKVKLSPIPLVNLYIEHWRNANQTELLRLAGVAI